jgi:hypothetical protein
MILIPWFRRVSRPGLTSAQDRWYAQTFHRAHAHLSAPINARPENWFTDLCTSRLECHGDHRYLQKGRAVHAWWIGAKFRNRSDGRVGQGSEPTAAAS